MTYSTRSFVASPLALAILACFGAAHAQQTPTDQQALPGISVKASRGAGVERSESYIAPVVNIGRTAQAPREIPQSITVVTRQQIEDTNAITLEDALKQVPGVTLNGYNDMTVYVRGFEIDAIQYDGVPSSVYGTAMPSPDLATIERVEVLRGAAGLLQGANSPGGAINLVRKRPREVFGASVAASVGSWDTWRLEGDLTGKLSDDGRVRGRVVAVTEERGSYIDYVGSHKQLAYGVLDWDLTSRTTLSIGASWQRVDELPSSDGLPRYTTGAHLFLPRSTFLGAAWNWRSFETSQTFIDIDQRIGESWKAKVSFSTLDSARASKGAYSNGALDPSTQTGVLSRWSENRNDSQQWGLEASIGGPFNLLGRKHELQAGVSFREEERHQRNGPGTALSSLGSLDPFTWDPSAVAEPGSRPYTLRNVWDYKQRGYWGVGRFSVADPVKLILGGRVSTWKDDGQQVGGEANTNRASFKVTDRFTPFAGLVWDLTHQWSAYASYADVFKVQALRDRNGDLLPPLVGSNIELGIKSDLADGALTTSFALFRIDQENRPQQDPDFPCATFPTNCYVAEGKVRSQGFEAQVAGQVAVGWQMSAGYTYNQTEYLKEERSNAGAITGAQGQSVSTFTPRNIVRLNTSYRLPGALNAWTLGGGLSSQSSWTVVQGALRWEQEAYTLLNLNASYRIDPRFTLALSVNNLSDKTYWRSMSGTTYGNVYGDPRNATLVLRGQF